MSTIKLYRFMKTCFLLEALFSPCQPAAMSEMEYLGHYQEPLPKQEYYQHYYVSANGASWTNANNDCQNLFGKYSGLVSIDTEDEKNYLNRLLEDYGYGAIYWTGGLYDPSSRVWRWETNNEPVGSWAPWENGILPPNPNALLRIGISFQNRFEADWITLWNTDLQRYICEVQYPTSTPLMTDSTTRATTMITEESTTSTPISPPIENEQLYAVISAIAPMALDVYLSDLTQLNQIQANYYNRSCSDLAQVWKVDQSGSDYIFRSSLGDGSKKWHHIMHLCTSRGLPHFPCIYDSFSSNKYIWRLSRVPGTIYWTIKNDYNTSYNTISYTGVSNGYGVNLVGAPFNSQDPAQWWEFIQC